MSKFKVEPGKTYVAENDAVIGPMEWWGIECLHSPDSPSPYNGGLWHQDGSAWKEGYHDSPTLVREHNPTNTLTVGQTYTAACGDKWECIAIRGEIAWMVRKYDDGEVSGSAFEYKIDGTPIAFGEHPDYRIVFEPVREAHRIPIQIELDDAYFHYDTVDGKFDPESIRVTFEVNT